MKAFLKLRDRERARKRKSKGHPRLTTRHQRNNSALVSLYIYFWKNGSEWEEMRMTRLMKVAERKGWIPPITPRRFGE